MGCCVSNDTVERRDDQVRKALEGLSESERALMAEDDAAHAWVGRHFGAVCVADPSRLATAPAVPGASAFADPSQRAGFSTFAFQPNAAPPHESASSSDAKARDLDCGEVAASVTVLRARGEVLRHGVATATAESTWRTSPLGKAAHHQLCPAAAGLVGVVERRAKEGTAQAEAATQPAGGRRVAVAAMQLVSTDLDADQEVWRSAGTGRWNTDNQEEITPVTNAKHVAPREVHDAVAPARDRRTGAAGRDARAAAAFLASVTTAGASRSIVAAVRSRAGPEGVGRRVVTVYLPADGTAPADGRANALPSGASTPEPEEPPAHRRGGAGRRTPDPSPPNDRLAHGPRKAQQQAEHSPGLAPAAVNPMLAPAAAADNDDGFNGVGAADAASPRRPCDDHGPATDATDIVEVRKEISPWHDGLALAFPAPPVAADVPNAARRAVGEYWATRGLLLPLRPSLGDARVTHFAGAGSVTLVDWVTRHSSVAQVAWKRDAPLL